MDAPLLCPFRYARVESHLHRGAFPTLKNFRFLRRLGLKTVLSLTPEAPTQDLLQFCKMEHINSIHISVNPKSAAKHGASPKVLEQVMQVLLDVGKHPMYVHCLDGGRVTGMFIMCLRKLQHWSLKATKDEFSRFLFSGVGGGTDARGAEVSSVETFSVLSVPAGIVPPAWLGSVGQLLFRDQHPTIRLRKEGDDSEQLAKSSGAAKGGTVGRGKHGKEVNKALSSVALMPREHQLWDDPSIVPRHGVAYVDSLPLLRYMHRHIEVGLCGICCSSSSSYGKHHLYVADPDVEPCDDLDLQDFADSGLLQALALEGVTMNPQGRTVPPVLLGSDLG
eukprot:gb/GEZN01007837.1/.p1 GENE.gb/GEZN01007837.1/~~gb/GEZN01007837.1/.p1  ORF type:complete len:335 (+),score=36.05 gb/GEZN01007837.1/:67-1071(+)